MSSYVPSSVYQHLTSQHQGPSTNSEGHNTDRGQELNEALVHYAYQPNTGDTPNAGAVADVQVDMLQCMLATTISPFGEHISPCREGFANLNSLMIHQRKKHGVRGPDWMGLDCVWLTNGDHICGEYIRKGGYKRHIAVHLGLRVDCEQCGKSFSRNDALKDHIKKKHWGVHL